MSIEITLERIRPLAMPIDAGGLLGARSLGQWRLGGERRCCKRSRWDGQQLHLLLAQLEGDRQTVLARTLQRDVRLMPQVETIQQVPIEAVALLLRDDVRV